MLASQVQRAMKIPKPTIKMLQALTLSVLLGALMAMPYDRLLDISGPLCTVLKSCLSTIALTGLLSDWPTEWQSSPDDDPSLEIGGQKSQM